MILIRRRWRLATQTRDWKGLHVRSGCEPTVKGALDDGDDKDDAPHTHPYP